MKHQFAVWIPSLQQDIFVNELSTQQQKELLKTITQPYNFEFTSALYTLLAEITNVDINNLTLIDKLVLLMKLRSRSISDKVEYTLVCTKCKKQVKNEISLLSLVNKINHLPNILDYEQEYENFKLTFGLPTILTELILERDSFISKEPDITNVGKAFGDLYLKDLLIFIKKLSITLPGSRLNQINFTSLNLNERKEIIEKLPSKLLKDTWEQIQEIKGKVKVQLLDIKCLCGSEILKLTLNVASPVYIQFIKSIFNENLHNVYQFIYYLTHVVGFTPEYIEQISPGERDLFWGYYIRDEKKKQEEQGNLGIAIPSPDR